jgi:hypothetical protein
MSLLYALPLLLALVFALYMVCRVLRAARCGAKRRLAANDPGTESAQFSALGSKRSQMRTDDDPTTVMQRITEPSPSRRHAQSTLNVVA